MKVRQERRMSKRPNSMESSCLNDGCSTGRSTGFHKTYYNIPNADEKLLNECWLKHIFLFLKLLVWLKDTLWPVVCDVNISSMSTFFKTLQIQPITAT